MRSVRAIHAVNPTDSRFPLCNTFGAYGRTDEAAAVTCGNCLRRLAPIPPSPSPATVDFDWSVCPVCGGRRTIRPYSWSSPEPCPRCVDEDEGA